MAGSAGEWRVRWWQPGAASRRPPGGGYHATTRGQSCTRYGCAASRAAPGPPRGRAMPGRRDAARAPAWCGERGPSSANAVDLPGPVSDQLSDNGPGSARLSPDDDGRSTCMFRGRQECAPGGTLKGVAEQRRDAAIDSNRCRNLACSARARPDADERLSSQGAARPGRQHP